MNNYQYIINPKNNKKYKITTKRGQNILRKQFLQLINHKEGGGNELAYILGIGGPIVGIVLLLLSCKL